MRFSRIVLPAAALLALGASASAQQQAPQTGAADAWIGKLRDMARKQPQVEIPGERVNKLKQGFWTYGQGGQPPRPGQLCTAAFMNEDGILQVAAKGGHADPAGLLLTGKDIPKAWGNPVVRAKLFQTGEKPATVRASYVHLMPGQGTIVFEIPSLDAAMDGFADESEIAVEVDGEPIYSLRYHSGHQAVAELRKCAGAA